MTAFVQSIHTIPQAIVAATLVLTVGGCVFGFIKYFIGRL
jgi:hypothetical protein